MILSGTHCTTLPQPPLPFMFDNIAKGGLACLSMHTVQNQSACMGRYFTKAILKNTWSENHRISNRCSSTSSNHQNNICGTIIQIIFSIGYFCAFWKFYLLHSICLNRDKANDIDSWRHSFRWGPGDLGTRRRQANNRHISRWRNTGWIGCWDNKKERCMNASLTSILI